MCSTDRGRTLTERSPCPQVLRRLFEIRFGGLEGDLRVRLARSPQRVTHAPASAALQGRTFERELALRTFAATDPALDRALRTLEDAVEELGPYSRLIRKFPEASDSIRAVALLPPELVDDAKAAEVEVLRRALAERLAEGEFAAIDGSDLLRFWPVEEGGRLGKAEASKFIQLLAKLRVGVEPDVRFGGPPLSPEAGAVLFAMSEGLSHREPSPAYRAAAAMIQLSAAAVAVDGKFADAEIAYLDREAERLRSSLALDAVELRRLRAVARRAMRTPPSLAGLKSQFEPLSVEERRRIGRFLVGTTAVDGRIDAAEIKFLGRAYKALGLDPATVHADVHAATAAPLPAEEPVRMREERRTPDGQPIPLAPQGALAAGVPPAVVLNPELVARTLRETDEVGLLLARVFAEAPPPAIPTSTPKDAGKSEVGGLVLESRHGALLRELLTQATWSRADFEAKARGHGLMPDGALEKINEAAFEAWDAPAIEGEDPLEVAIDLFGKVEP